jgi:short-subunit dehydrogenase
LKLRYLPEISLKILITGGTRGLGRKIAESLIMRGHEANCILADIDRIIRSESNIGSKDFKKKI